MTNKTTEHYGNEDKQQRIGADALTVRHSEAETRQPEDSGRPDYTLGNEAENVMDTPLCVAAVGGLVPFGMFTLVGFGPLFSPFMGILRFHGADNGSVLCV